MKVAHRGALLAERAHLKTLVDQYGSENRNVLTIMGLRARLEELEAELLEFPERHYASVTIRFRGDPVSGTSGVSAKFASAAVGAFTKAISTVGASLQVGLRARGPLPVQDQHRFMISDIARGSFGFELVEEPAPVSDEAGPEQGSLPLGVPSPASEALQRTLDVLSVAVKGDEEAAADVLSNLSPRARNSIRAFVRTLNASHAFGDLESESQQVVFRSTGDVASAVTFLGETNVKTSEELLTGELLGTLPDGRRFEFLTDSGEVISGRIDKPIGDPQSLSHHFPRRARITVSTTRVGAGRPQFTLIEVPEFLD